jgi:hypothetical protein
MAEYAEGVTEISPVLADAIGLRREIVPQNKFLLRIGWGEGGRRPDEVTANYANHANIFNHGWTRINTDFSDANSKFIQRSSPKEFAMCDSSVRKRFCPRLSKSSANPQWIQLNRIYGRLSL